jgi:ketosteroid isomerase-like protein
MPKPSCLLLVLFALTIPLGAQAQRDDRDESDIGKALSSFIRAFDDLDWDKFRMCFADDATVFYPRGYPKRADGRAEFEKTFKAVFEQIRGNKVAPPYMDIKPRDLETQRVGGVAIVTFHLDDRPGFINRRTLVLVKFAGEWKILHLHASEVSIAKPKP